MKFTSYSLGFYNKNQENFNVLYKRIVVSGYFMFVRINHVLLGIVDQVQLGDRT